jgi:bleomycin hydrolase
MAGISLRDYVSLVHVPMSDKRFSTLYTVKYLGNVWEGEPIHYLNLEMPTIKELVLRQLSDGEGVWFGSDISHMCDRETGMMVRNLFQLAETLGADLAMDKGQRLDYHESRLNHAMVIRGVNIVDGRPNRWKVENSWGKEVGDEGYFLMDDGWFDEFVYQAAIHKKYLPADLLALLRQPATVLRPWDPLGSLAGMSGR